jgi:response regulator RpfG family c-di-GMP phosphodiesterase
MSEMAKILVVDDDPIALRLIVQALTKAGKYDILSAPGAGEGFSIALKERPLLIISDYRMEETNGFEFCRMVKGHAELGGTIFVVCSATGDIESKAEGLRLGADDYITKPVDYEEMLLRVRALLRLKSLQDELAEDKAALEDLNRQLHDDFTGIISLLTKVLSQRIPDAVARAEQASAMCEWLADRLDMDVNQKRTLVLAGRLKEIGKIGLTDDLLRLQPSGHPKGEHDPREQSGLLGYLLLNDIPQLKDVATILRHQNESFDGSGYPDRLHGATIPIGSRVLRAINLAQDLVQVRNGSLQEASQTLLEAVGTVLEPRIGLLVEEYMRVVADPFWKEGKRSVRVEDLKEGMVIACDLITGRGVMLLAKDSKLTDSQIKHLVSMSYFDPIIHQIFVYEAAGQVA